MGAEVGLLGLIVLGLDIWAVVRILSSGATAGAKALWLLLIAVLPVIGFLIWALAGPK